MIRARMRRRWPALVALTTGALLLVPIGVSAASAVSPQVAAPTSCELNLLPVPGEATWGDVTAGDPSGRYLVGRYGTGTASKPVLWDNGALHAIESPGNAWIYLSSINADGVAVGYTDDYSGGDRPQDAWVYRDGELRKLPGLDKGYALTINPAGDILGMDSSDPNGPETPVLWPAGSDQPVAVPVPAGHTFHPGGLADDGTLVGTLMDNELYTKRVYALRADGTGFELPLPSDAEFANDVQAHGSGVAAIVNPGTSGDWYRTVVWDLDAPGQPPVDVTDQLGSLQAFNEQGWVAGEPVLDERDKLVFASAEGGDFDLPALSNWGLADIVTSISTDGRVLGGRAVTDPAGNDITDHAVQWNCS